MSGDSPVSWSSSDIFGMENSQGEWPPGLRHREDDYDSEELDGMHDIPTKVRMKKAARAARAALTQEERETDQSGCSSRSELLKRSMTMLKEHQKFLNAKIRDVQTVLAAIEKSSAQSGGPAECWEKGLYSKWSRPTVAALEETIDEAERTIAGALEAAYKDPGTVANESEAKYRTLSSEAQAALGEGFVGAPLRDLASFGASLVYCQSYPMLQWLETELSSVVNEGIKRSKK